MQKIDQNIRCFEFGNSNFDVAWDLEFGISYLLGEAPVLPISSGWKSLAATGTSSLE
jgi:hypothetical protein